MTIPSITPSPLANLRDLGGIKAAAGRIRPGVIWRSDDISLIDEDSALSLVDNGLHSVIDLRSFAEVNMTGRGVLGTHPVSYHHIPFMASVKQSVTSLEEVLNQPRFEQMYIRIFENAAPQIVTSLAIIAHSPGTVAFHCAAGQDRTGVLAAALLLSVGVEEQDIVADYALTGHNSAAIRDRLAPIMGPLMTEMGINLDQAARAALRTEFSPAPMIGLMSYLRRTYSDPLVPLKRAGLSDSLIAQLGAKVVI
ncbi:tyrosine-protein phosphatase [Corynebacterium alimapuense]|nr:tyrosine-protein phosphatase [Corynebacterium alimapuense]